MTTPGLFRPVRKAQAAAGLAGMPDQLSCRQAASHGLDWIGWYYGSLLSPLQKFCMGPTSFPQSRLAMTSAVVIPIEKFPQLQSASVLSMLLIKL